MAWCIALKVSENDILATAQFPPLGVSEISDHVFEKICAGEVSGASHSC